MRFVDVAYYYNRTDRPELLPDAHRANVGYFDFLPDGWQCTLVKFADGEGHADHGRFNYHYFQGKGSRFWLPRKANRFIADQNPDVVMVHGLVFPQQVLLLKSVLPRHTRIIIQHHADVPGGKLMGFLQRRADRHVSAYLFAAKELAEPWIRRGIISRDKVYQVMEGSTDLPVFDKHAARHHLQLPGGPVFLWVGRLDANKDPLTVLRGFRQYLREQGTAKLYMVYHTDELLQPVREMISSDELLSASVILKGKLEKKDLAYWYNAADYYISGSHSEGSGYALIEAMGCGCVPVVTDIPSFRQITGNGDVGFLFDKANEKSLCNVLRSLDHAHVKQFAVKVKEQFERELSFRAIAGQLAHVCERIGVKDKLSAGS